MYWWDYAAVQFFGMLVIGLVLGLLCGFSIADARNGGAFRRRRTRPKRAVTSTELRLARLEAFAERFAAALRRLEAMEYGRNDCAITRLPARRAEPISQCDGEAA